MDKMKIWSKMRNRLGKHMDKLWFSRSFSKSLEYRLISMKEICTDDEYNELNEKLWDIWQEYREFLIIMTKIENRIKDEETEE